jgi:hypothetical protein
MMILLPLNPMIVTVPVAVFDAISSDLPIDTTTEHIVRCFFRIARFF